MKESHTHARELVSRIVRLIEALEPLPRSTPPLVAVAAYSALIMVLCIALWRWAQYTAIIF